MAATYRLEHSNVIEFCIDDDEVALSLAKAIEDGDTSSQNLIFMEHAKERKLIKSEWQINRLETENEK